MQKDFSKEAKFMKNLKKYTITFRNPKLEDKYRKTCLNRSLVNDPFKFLLMILIALVAFRRIEAVIFTCLKIEAYVGPQHVEKLNVILLFITAFSEALVYVMDQLHKCRGFFFMVYIYFSSTYASAATHQMNILPS